MGDAYNSYPSKAEMIRWRVVLAYYHEDKPKMVDIAKGNGLTKPEVTKAVQELEKEGILEKNGSKNISLTDTGYEIAQKYHRKYEIAYANLEDSFNNEAKVSQAAHMVAMTFPDEYFERRSVSNNAKALMKKLEGYFTFDGKQFCEAVEDGTYPISFTLLTVPHPFNRNSVPTHSHGCESHEVINKEITAEDLLDEDRAFKERNSMANFGFVHPTVIKIKNDIGYLHLHRVLMAQRSMKTGEMMSGKANCVEYFDGTKFVKCQINGDDIEVPLEYFWFCRQENLMQGKLRMRFECTVNEVHMPPGEAVMVITI